MKGKLGSTTFRASLAVLIIMASLLKRPAALKRPVAAEPHAGEDDIDGEECDSNEWDLETDTAADEQPSAIVETKPKPDEVKRVYSRLTATALAKSPQAQKAWSDIAALPSRGAGQTQRISSSRGHVMSRSRRQAKTSRQRSGKR